MGAEIKRIMLDVNVVLDDYLPDRETGLMSRELIDRCRLAGIELLYPAASVQNIFYVIVSALKRAVRSEGREVTPAVSDTITRLAWSCVDNLEELGTPVGMDGSDIWLAGKHRDLNPDLEDDLVIAACKRAGADYLATNDRKLREKSPVPALSPEDLLALIG